MENGYNYQAHIYNGEYQAGWNLIMKWNDAWISNQDCDKNGKLDRPGSYKGSGAWLTNHQFGVYTDASGKECHWTYFTKIVAAPLDATLNGYKWINSDGTEIGPAIWGDFATIQTVNNDPCFGLHGLEYVSPDHAGFGGW